jgi:hypothetical protein
VTVKEFLTTKNQFSNREVFWAELKTFTRICGYVVVVSEVFCAYRARRRTFCLENIQVMSGNDSAPIEFANLLQCLLLAAGLPTVLSPRLITTGVGTMI